MKTKDKNNQIPFIWIPQMCSPSQVLQSLARFGEGGEGRRGAAGRGKERRGGGGGEGGEGERVAADGQAREEREGDTRLG
jgi:hypothetical protein